MYPQSEEEELAESLSLLKFVAKLQKRVGVQGNMSKGHHEERLHDKITWWHVNLFCVTELKTDELHQHTFGFYKTHWFPFSESPDCRH